MAGSRVRLQCVNGNVLTMFNVKSDDDGNVWSLVVSALDKFAYVESRGKTNKSDDLTG